MTDHPPPGADAANITCIHCGYDLSGAAVGGRCAECGASVSESVAQRRKPSLFGAAQDLVLDQEDRLGYVAPALITILCCVPGGVVALIYTARANSAITAGAFLLYERNKILRDRWMLASIAIGLLVNLMFVIMEWM